MRIFDKNNVEIDSPDLDLGYLAKDKLFVQHHEAVEEVKEEGHYETIAEYPNGGKDVKWVVDVPAVEACEAYDEYEDIQRYVEYTAEELEERDRVKNTPTQLDRIEAQVFYTAMLTDTLISTEV